MKLAKVLFGALAVVASTFFVSCTTSQVDKFDHSNPVSTGAVSGSQTTVAGADGVAVSQVGTVVLQAADVPQGGAIKLDVVTSPENLTATVVAPKETAPVLAITGCAPFAEYIVTSPSAGGEIIVSKVYADANGIISFLATSGTYVIKPTGNVHSGGAAN